MRSRSRAKPPPLITCRHRGCSLVGAIKKAKRVSWHCSGYKAKCPEPEVREQALEERFARALEDLRFDDQIMSWAADALRQSHAPHQKRRLLDRPLSNRFW